MTEKTNCKMTYITNFETYVVAYRFNTPFISTFAQYISSEYLPKNSMADFVAEFICPNNSMATIMAGKVNSELARNVDTKYLHGAYNINPKIMICLIYL